MYVIEQINFKYLLIDGAGIKRASLIPGDLVFLEERQMIGKLIQELPNLTAYQSESVKSFYLYEDIHCCDFENETYNHEKMMKLLNFIQEKGFDLDREMKLASVTTIVETFGLRLMYFPEYNDDKELVQKAVSNHGLSILFASERLQRDDDIVRTAVHTDLASLFFLNAKFHTLDFILSCNLVWDNRLIYNQILTNLIKVKKEDFYDLILFGGYPEQQLCYLIPNEHIVDYNILALYNGFGQLPYDPMTCFETPLFQILCNISKDEIKRLLFKQQILERNSDITSLYQELEAYDKNFFFYQLLKRWKLYRNFEYAYFIWFEDQLFMLKKFNFEEIQKGMCSLTKRIVNPNSLCQRATSIYASFTNKNRVFYWDDNHIQVIFPPKCDEPFFDEERVMIRYAFMFALYELVNIKIPIIIIQPQKWKTLDTRSAVVEYINRKNARGQHYIVFSLEE